MKEKKLSPSEIKLNNRQMIYRYIRKEGSVSKQDIVIALMLSLPTVTQNLEYLKEKKLIDTSQKITNTGGRNATAFTYAKTAKMAIGVYITGHHINVVAVDLLGNVIEVRKERELFDLDDDEYLKKIGMVVEQVKCNTNISDENLLGVGIAVPGMISEDGEAVKYGLTLNFTGKTRKEISKYIPYQTRLLHDSFAAGSAEARVEYMIDNGFYISLSNSVGGSIIINNEIYVGDTSKAGEIGHMTVIAKGGERCYCGKDGCFDTLCRATILDEYTDGILEDFFCMLEQKDSTAIEKWDVYLDNLALAIHNIRILFDGVVIIGGHVGAYIETYMDDLCERVDKKNPFGDKAKDYVIPCKYTIEAAAAGAAISYIEEFIDSI